MFTLSRLDPVKQLDWAIDAAYFVAAEFPETQFTLDICGKGPDRPRLEQRLEAHGKLQNLDVNFAGFVDSITTPLKRSQLFLFPSRSEGFPLSLTEAAISGIPCVANNCPHGPADIARSFPNVTLVDPPHHQQFLKLVLKSFQERYSQTVSESQRPVTWPSIEELTNRLSNFFSTTAEMQYARNEYGLEK